MKALIEFLKQKWFIQLVGVVAICAMIWFAGPLFGFADKKPLASEFNRLLAILITVIVWAVYNLTMRTRSEKTDQQLIHKMTASGADQAEIEEKQKEELKALQLKFEDALQKLKSTQSENRRGRRYLYELPWYVIIGAPGCGKTTLFMNPEILPLPEYMDAKERIRGVGGTRNCDWLFTHDAIFLDTAGRFATHDSHQPVDEAAWEGFLKLIKEYRPRRPVNGILVAASIYDLLRKTDEQRQQHARQIRNRIEDLHKTLGIQFPIYMVFTKCDLISGFADFFADLYPEERAQVWGRTFGEYDAEQTNDSVSGFHDDFEKLLDRLNQRTLTRVHEEKDIRRRSRILDFPRQMALVKPAITDFIRYTFSSGRHQTPLLLRGIYFTSGTQEGMPMDRIMGILSKTYGLDEQNVPIYSGKGRSYFVLDLLKKVILPEAEMASADLRVEHRRQWLNYAAYGSVLLMAAVIFIAWTVSFINNKSYISSVQDEIAGYDEIPRTADDWDSGVKNLHKKLGILKSASRVREESSKWMGMGLDQRDKVSELIGHSYERMLTGQLLPVIKTRLEQRLSGSIKKFGVRDQDKTGDLYNLLKVYLMLNPRPSAERKGDLDLAVEKIGEDWDESFYVRGEQFKTGYRQHIRDLFLIRSDSDSILLNQTLIRDAREKLNSVPLSDQIYNQLKSQYLPDKTHDFRLGDIMYLDQIFGHSALEMKIPGLFTAAGYNEIFNKQGIGFVENAVRQNWVIQNPDAGGEKSDSRVLYHELQRVYFIDYIENWSRLLKELTIRPSADVHSAGKILHRLTSRENPLRQLLQEIEKNTSFLEEKVPDSDYLGANLRRFRRLNSLVEASDGAPSLLDEVIGRLKELRNFMHRYDSPEIALDDLKKRMRGGGDLISSTQKYFEQLPDPLGKWLSSLTSSARKATLSAAKSTLNSIWKAEVLGPYTETLAGRYPLSKHSPENVSLDDFIRFFKPDGIIDSFLTEHIRPFVDPDWTEKSVDNKPIGLSANALAQFRKSERIREIFFVGNGTPNIGFELKPESLDASVREFQLRIEGKTIRYRHGLPRNEKFQWPEQEGRPVSVVEWRFKTFDGQMFHHSEEGPWAWFRALDRVGLTRKDRNRFIITFRANGYKARYRMGVSSVINPFASDELQHFRCPESL